MREGLGRDELTDELAIKRPRRRASSHTKQCSPKAKAHRCRRTVKHEKSKPRTMFIVYFLLGKFLPPALWFSQDWASGRRFPPAETGIE